MSRPVPPIAPYHRGVAEFEASGIRISDTERESALTALGEHMGTGRLDIDEYGDRSAKVATAKTRADLLELFEDLPLPHPTFAGETPAAPTPAAPVRPARQGTGSTVVMRAMGALVPLAFLGALVAVIFLHAFWFVFLVPVALTMVGSSIWGKGWNKERQYRAVENREHAHDVRDQVRDQMRDARDQVRDQMRQAHHQMRDSRREWHQQNHNQNRQWQQELKQQVRNEVYRRMRDRRRG
jgi:hypothetical protein